PPPHADLDRTDHVWAELATHAPEARDRSLIDHRVHGAAPDLESADGLLRLSPLVASSNAAASVLRHARTIVGAVSLDWDLAGEPDEPRLDHLPAIHDASRLVPAYHPFRPSRIESIMSSQRSQSSSTASGEHRRIACSRSSRRSSMVS